MKQTVSSPRRLELPRNAAEWLEAIMNFLFFLCGILAVGCVVLISAYMVLSGVPAIRQIGLFRFLHLLLLFLRKKKRRTNRIGKSDVLCNRI